MKEILFDNKGEAEVEDDLHKWSVEEEDFEGLSSDHLFHAQPQDVTVRWETKNQVGAGGEDDEMER